MDERHWWIAGKIQESFHIGGYDNPTLLEDFLSEENTLSLINEFLNPGGLNRLFFYCETPETGAISTRQLHIASSVSNVKLSDSTAILYFLRHHATSVVDPTHMERDVFCGEIKGRAIETFGTMLGELYIPILKAQKDWGECSPDNQVQFVNSLDKFMSSFSEIGFGSASSQHWVLKQPDGIIGATDFKQHRLAALDQQVITEYEQLVSEWISTIESILNESSDDRNLDPNYGPLAELDRWRRRQRLLSSLTEQLKSKECKAVIHILITAKSRLLKKWKVTDSGISDALNETRDKVRYLESMKRSLDQLYSGATPSSIINTALPGILASIKQLEAVSRYYARQGFLGMFFTKITNQLVLACKEYLQEMTMSVDDDDLLWHVVREEIESYDETWGDAFRDGQQKLLSSQLESRLKGSRGQKESKIVDLDEGTLVSRMKACLTLQNHYCEMIHSVRDSFGGSNQMSQGTSLSSLGPGSNVAGKGKLSPLKGTKPGTGALSRRGGSIQGEETSGVSVADEEMIMHHLDNFCNRIKQMLNIITTMAQFNQVMRKTAGLPRPKKDDLVYEETEEEKEKQEEKENQDEKDEEEEMEKEQIPESGEPQGQSLGSRLLTRSGTQLGRDQTLDVIVESDEHAGTDGASENSKKSLKGENKPDAEESSKPASEEALSSVLNYGGGMTRFDIQILKKYYPDHLEDDGPSVMSIVKMHLDKINSIAVENITTNIMLDVESKDSQTFDSHFELFIMIVQDLENFVCAYLNALFIRKLKTSEALNFMNRFLPIQLRPGVRVTISEKFVETFNWYEADLEEAANMYEKYKEEPPVLRNAPPVAGAICWARQLLRRIEEPMKVFNQNKAVAQSKDFSRVVKIYNRLATVLVTFESLWFNYWKDNVAHALTGLRATLFVLHPDTKEILVNVDEKVLELIQEAKHLQKLGLEIPESAVQVLQQAKRFKSYKDHLEQCIEDFQNVCQSIPEALLEFFEDHVEKARQTFMAGLSTLSWNSMNIDAFLHQIRSGTMKLKSLVDQVNKIMTEKVDGTIDAIRDMIFFDYKLAFSRSWPPGEFSPMMARTVREQGDKLYDHIVDIEESIRNVVLILRGKKTKPREPTTSTQTMTTKTEKPDDRMVSKLLSYYCDQIYEAILLATTRSLVTLAESSGCDAEIIRVTSAMSDAPSSVISSPRVKSASASRVTSAASVRSRPVSVLSMLSNMTWTTDMSSEITYLRFEVLVKYNIPNTVVEPSLDTIQYALSSLAKQLLTIPQGIVWCGSEKLGEKFMSLIGKDEVVNRIMKHIQEIVEELEAVVKQHIFHFSLYDFLWKDDMQSNYEEFIKLNPELYTIEKEVDRLLMIEQKVLSIPKLLPVGCICLDTVAISDALHGFAIAWKTRYVSLMREEAKKKLDAAVQYRLDVRECLEMEVGNLDLLNSTLHLLEEVRDMENKVDAVYLPIETMYQKLRDFNLRLPREEVQQVDSLRDKWQELLELAELVRRQLLIEQRGAFEQELDKQVKTFVVEVIQFRNAFDAQGPAIPGISPSEAVERLENFRQRYAMYDTKRKTLESVSKLFGIPIKPFGELDKTGEELDLLSQLYGLFQKFIMFNDRFRETLWAEVDLEVTSSEVESYWDECLALPSKLKDWDAYNDMKSSIQMYLDVFPLLRKLASKEIRNRHWLQVMSVAGSTFQLEANVFRLHHLLNIGLLKHRSEIEEICRSASRELELEIKLRMTEEEWTEQVLNFDHYKRRGPMYLNKASTERLLEQLEDAQVLLAQMLTSRYVGPLREEAASWAEKLKEVALVLEQWLEVQDLWQYLEAVFSNNEAAKDLPQEAKRFSQTDKVWTKMMKRAYDTRNVLQCCYGGDVPKSVVLHHIYEELEVCFKSLVGYLDNKRCSFPRFYFVSNPVLLSMLSRPTDLESVRPYLRVIFGAVNDVQLEKMSRETEGLEDETLRDGRRSGSGRNTPLYGGTNTPTPKIDKRLIQVQANLLPGVLTHVSTMLPSEEIAEEMGILEAVSVISGDGEYLKLHAKVLLEAGVESWLTNLKQAISKTLYFQLVSVLSDSSPEDWAYKYSSQACTIGMLCLWTRECEQGIAELKYDRKALLNTSRKFTYLTNKFPLILSRGYWRSYDESMTAVHKQRLENLISQSLFLRDMIDNMTSRKLRETTDFEWRRCLRVYLQTNGEEMTPFVTMLDQQFQYGCEFYGATPVLGLTPLTDKCYLAMAQAIGQQKGAMLVGATGTGKTETIKGFAHMLGKFLVAFGCSEKSNPVALGRVLQGIAMDGSWACFENIQQLNSEGLSRMLDHIQVISYALQVRQDHCIMNDGQEIPLNNQLAMFVTASADSSLPTKHLSQDISSKFRQISLIKPDLGLLLRSKCVSFGFKAPALLAMRLRLVSEFVKDLMPEGGQHDLSLAALVGVLQKASQKKRNVKEEKSSERLVDKPPLEKRPTRNETDVEMSRSNSQLSMTPVATSVMGANKPGRKTATPNQLTNLAKQEHAVVAQVLLDVLGPRLTPQNMSMFRTIVTDVFKGLPDAPPQMLASASGINSPDIESAVITAAEDTGLIPQKPWVDKCIQFHGISQVHQGLIVAGPPGCGKSTIVQTVVDAMCVMPQDLSRLSTPTQGARSEVAEGNHKLQKIYPLVVDDLSLIFGHLNSNGEWVDGIFTSTWKKASRNMCTTWLCLDGPLHSSWVDNLSSALDDNKILNLANGDKLFLSENIKIVFETEDLSTASPAIVSRTGILYVDQMTVGWRPIARAWLENRSQQEVHVLQRAFDKTVEPISRYVMNECRCRIALSEVGMFHMCLGLLSAMLADNIEIGGELHIERLYLFCMMWSFGGLLEEKERKGFNNLFSSLSTALPDDDRDIDFFDYYVDESGEWDPWHARIPETSYLDQQDFLGEIFVDTVNTIQAKLLLGFAGAGGQNVLLVGPHGSGKTTVINNFLNSGDPQTQVTKRVVYSGASSTIQLQQYIEANIYHRQGFVYGAKDNRKMALFVDDLNLPLPDKHGCQRINELLRRLLDDHIICTLERPFEWQSVEDLQVYATMSLSESCIVGDKPLPARLLRHFAVIQLPAPQDEALQNIVHGMLESHMLANEQPGIEIELHNQLVKASCRLLKSVSDVLHVSPMPGRRHYIFNLKDLVSCFQCLRRIPDEGRADELMVASMWKHEVHCILMDRISRHSDRLWLDECIGEIVKETWPDLEDKMHDLFITFPIDSRSYNRPINVSSRKEVKVSLQPITSVADVRSCLQTHLGRYNEEFGNVHINTMLSNNVLCHVIKMHRIFSFCKGGNLVLVGPIGAHLAVLVRLALHVADIPIHQVDASKQSNFLDGLRSAVRLTGAEGKVLSLLFTAGRDLNDDSYLDALNSLLVSGEYPHLFSNDEMEGLLQALQPVLRREHPSVPLANLNKFFVSRVKANLHIVICLPPSHKLISVAARQYPGLLTGSQVVWVSDWPQDVLMEDSAYYLDRYSVTENCESDIKAKVTITMANIHSFMLQECKQTRWVGPMSDDIQINELKNNEKKKDQQKQPAVSVPNRPYAKNIMMENIRMRARDVGLKSIGEVFVGPTTFLRFMNTFKHIYSQKAEKRTETVEKLRKVLATLEQTRRDSKGMKDSIKTINQRFEESKIKTSDLLVELTSKVTLLEKLKAKVGVANALSAFLQLNELSEDEEETDDLLKQEERDEYDDEFDKRREANLKTRQIQAKEEYAEAVRTLEECRKNLAYAREQVTFWKSRVDRPTVERIRQFVSPPMLVGQVMEMVLVLIGKRMPNQRLEGLKENLPARDEQSGRYSTSSGSTKYTVSTKKANLSRPGDRRASFITCHLHAEKVKDSSERFDRQSWKSMQITMSDSSKFVDMLHNVPWEDGLPLEVADAVESFLAISQDGKLGITGEGTLLENASEKEKSLVPVRRSPSPDNTRGITIAAAKYSSEDIATLVQYTIAIVEYSRLCTPLKAALERLQELQREIEENERIQKEKEDNVDEQDNKAEIENQEENLTEEDLPRIQQEVNDLQEKFDMVVVEKHSLEVELRSLKERLKAATDMMASLKPHESNWKEYAEDHKNNDILVANCIAAAAFLVYCAPLNTDARDRIGSHFVKICEENGLPLPSKLLFRETELFEFLYKPVDICKLEQLKLPMTRLMLENATFILQGENTESWPLMLDPTSRCISWMKQYLGLKSLVMVKYYELKSQLDTCLADGLPLLVTDCDLLELSTDHRFLQVIHSRNKFVPGQSPFKIPVGDHEVEVQPHFRLYLHSTSLPHEVPPELGAYLSLIYFHATRDDVQQELLDRFMAQEKSRLEGEKTTLLEEGLENLCRLEELEAHMVDCLSSDVRLLHDLPTTKKVVELLKNYEETQESQRRVEGGAEVINRAKEGFQEVALRGAVLYSSMQAMKEINPLYTVSFDHFLFLYDSAIAQSDRAAMKVVTERLTYNAFSTTIKSLHEKDRFVFILLLAIEIEDGAGNVKAGEREFLVSPILGSATMTAAGYAQPADSKFATAKKPFDWMTDDQFNNLQILAVHFEWFQEAFDRMPRDGRETQWRNLCESDQPELQAFPDKMHESYTPLQWLLVIRAVRIDRFIHAAMIFINNILGKKYVNDQTIDLMGTSKQGSPTMPILLLYTTEKETVEKMFTETVNKKQVQVATVSLSGNGQTETKKARRVLQAAMSEGTWVMLQNGHHDPDLLASLETLFSEAEQVSPNFRCWISTETVSTLPVRLLQNSIKITIDPPRTLRDTLCRGFSWMAYTGADILKQSSKPEWAPFLHNLCYLHGAVRLRARFGRSGWNCPQDMLRIGKTELREALQLGVQEFRDNLIVTLPDGTQIPRNTSWTGVRFMLTEMIYGKYITDPADLQSLGSMIDFWISPAAVKKDFEVPKLKYKLPPPFFMPHPRLGLLVQALEGLPWNSLEVPEACHIHTSPENALDDNQYILSCLNKVYDSMPASETLLRHLFPWPTTIADALETSLLAEDTWNEVLRQSPLVNNHHVITDSALIRIHGMIHDISAGEKGSPSEGAVFASSSYCMLQMRKEMDLLELCQNMLTKVPRAYNKEFVSERIKKIGGNTPFNLFIVKELDLMYKLLTTIKSTLQAIKSACETSNMGDELTPEMLAIANDLYHMRIPSMWCRMAGETAPPPTHNLSSWLLDLTNRGQHFERILAYGREKMPSYCLGAFFYPRGLLALLKLECYRQHGQERSGNIEQFVFQTEITARDKDHIRDPPAEGIFIYGIYLWGITWEKTTGELLDSTPRNAFSQLPVIHLTCWSQGDKPILQDQSKAGEVYSCPVYQTRNSTKQPVLELDLHHSGVPTSRWAIRGLSATIRPF